MTRSQLMQNIADKAGLKKREASKAFRALQGICLEQIQSNGEFTFPGIVKLRIRPVKELPIRSRWSPKQGCMVQVPPRPAGKRLRAKPLRAIKVLVNTDSPNGVPGDRSHLVP